VGVSAELDAGEIHLQVADQDYVHLQIQASPALALTIVDAVVAYARLNGMLVCDECGHESHAPRGCEHSYSTGMLCACAAGVPEFDDL
jgi:hypothetical protein